MIMFFIFTNIKNQIRGKLKKKENHQEIEFDENPIITKLNETKEWVEIIPSKLKSFDVVDLWIGYKYSMIFFKTIQKIHVKSFTEKKAQTFDFSLKENTEYLHNVVKATFNVTVVSGMRLFDENGLILSDHGIIPFQSFHF